MENFGYVKKISDNQFIVKADINQYGSGYSVVPREQDPENMYDIEDVRAYVEQHSDMLFADYNVCSEDPRNQMIKEIAEHENWLCEVYDMQVKQYQRCVRLGQPYDCKYGTIVELDNIAVNKAQRIKELQCMLEQQ